MKIHKLTSHYFFYNKKIKQLELLKSQGVCNKIYKVTTIKKDYCLRVFKHIHDKKNHRRTEYNIQKEVAKHKISPKPYVFDKEFILCDFIEGKHKKKISKKSIKKIAKTLKKLHKIDYKCKPCNLKKEFKKYKKILNDKKSKKLINKALKDLQELKQYKSNLVLCHHDLNCYNIIFSKNKTYFIDWEFACINDSFFDLASICIEFRLNNKQQKQFLRHYFHKIEPNPIKKLEIYKRIYTNLWNLWFKAIKI